MHSSIRQAFRKYPVVFFGLLISFACGAVSLVLHASAADAFIITVVTTILPISVEILIRLGPLEQFEILSREQLQQIADNAKVHDCVKATLACYQTLAHFKGSGNAFCRQLEVAMEDHTTQLYSFSRGMFTSNLNPNNLFRESDLLAVFNSTMLATSMSIRGNTGQRAGLGVISKSKQGPKRGYVSRKRIQHMRQSTGFLSKRGGASGTWCRFFVHIGSSIFELGWQYGRKFPRY